MDLSQNALTGWIPTEIGQLTRLEENFYISADTEMSGPLPSQACGIGYSLYREFRSLPTDVT